MTISSPHVFANTVFRKGEVLMNAGQFVFVLFVVLPPAFVAPIFADDSRTKAALVTRERVALNLAGAEMILRAALQKASTEGFKMNIAVVDEGGHLIAFARMDGARPASANTALTKAVTAATFRQATGPLPPAGEPDILLNLSLQNAAAGSGGKITTLKGGVPIIVDDQVIGAVGVGGGSGEQDAEVATAGIQALTAALRLPLISATIRGQGRCDRLTRNSSAMFSSLLYRPSAATKISEEPA